MEVVDWTFISRSKLKNRFEQIMGNGVLDNKGESEARNKLGASGIAASLIYVRLDLWLNIYQVSKASNVFISLG